MEGYPGDQDLVQRTLAGDWRSFEQIVERYQQPVFRIVYRLLRDRQDAEDIAQETFLRCYQKLGSYDQTRSFTPWLYRIATNLALSRLRRRRRQQVVPWGQDRELPGTGYFPDPEEAWERKETGYEVAQALKSLKPLDQMVLILRYFEELSYEEIALILKTTRNNVEVRICRARQRLRKLLSPIPKGKFYVHKEGERNNLCSPVEK